MVFFFNDTATTEIYTLSLHDALPISCKKNPLILPQSGPYAHSIPNPAAWFESRSEEHTSELQSHHDLVCRLLLEKKKQENPGRTGRPAGARTVPESRAPIRSCAPSSG